MLSWAMHTGLSVKGVATIGAGIEPHTALVQLKKFMILAVLYESQPHCEALLLRNVLARASPVVSDARLWIHAMEIQCQNRRKFGPVVSHRSAERT